VLICAMLLVPLTECTQFGFPQHMSIRESSDWSVELDFDSTGECGSGRVTAINWTDTNLKKFGEFHGEINGTSIEVVSTITPVGIKAMSAG
jgi:hypothetical protein